MNTLEQGGAYSSSMKPVTLMSTSSFPTLHWSSMQEGDILGVYQPDDGDNILQLYYQDNTGPVNYLKSSINPPPPSSFTQTTPATQLYYPLVSVVVSTSGKHSICNG